MDILRISRDIPSKDPEILFNILGFPVSTSFVSILLVILIFIALAVFIKKRFKLSPSGFQASVEIIYEGILSLLDQITQSRKITEKIFPIIGALFVYLGVANLIGLVPGLTAITFEGKYLFITPTADFNTTFGLALVMVFLLQLVSIRDYGFFGHLGKYFQFKEVYLGFEKGFGEGFLAIINFFIGLLDIISEVAKVVSLSLRLFGNMYAGAILATLVLASFAYILPAAWLAMNLLQAVIHALVFGVLIAAYYTLAAKPEEEKISN